MSPRLKTLKKNIKKGLENFISIHFLIILDIIVSWNSQILPFFQWKCYQIIFFTRNVALGFSKSA